MLHSPRGSNSQGWARQKRAARSSICVCCKDSRDSVSQSARSQEGRIDGRTSSLNQASKHGTPHHCDSVVTNRALESKHSTSPSSYLFLTQCGPGSFYNNSCDAWFLFVSNGSTCNHDHRLMHGNTQSRLAQWSPPHLLTTPDFLSTCFLPWHSSSTFLYFCSKL